MGKHKNLTNQVFGRLTVLSKTDLRGSNGAVVWLCMCECGREKCINGQSLLSGSTRSCGCFLSESTRERARSRAIHGLSNTPIGNTWTAMVARCKNSKIKPFRKYGARGIWVCSYLEASPLNIIAIIGERPSDKTLDRINGKGGYTCGKCLECVANQWPLNIRWLTPKEQARNMSRNRMITINGETKCLEDWSQKSGLRSSTIAYRLNIGLIGEAILQPSKRGNRLT